MKYFVGNKEHLHALTVEAKNMNAAIDTAAKILNADAQERIIFGDSYARVVFVKNRVAALIVQWAIR